MDSGAIDGIRVVDFGQYLAGPLVGMFLADNGADVIQIVPPTGPRWKHPVNAILQRNKRVVALDLKTEAGREVARRLIATADVVIENFRPDVMSKLGLGRESFSDVNDKLIWCSIPGFPEDDPRAGMPAWEGVVCAAAGLYPPPAFQAGDPIFTALPLASNYAAFLAAHRIAAALLARLRFGRGQHIKVSLFEASFQGVNFFAEAPPSRTFTKVLSQRLAPIMRMRPTADGKHLFFDTPLRGIQGFLDRFLPGNDLLAIEDDQIEDLAGQIDRLIVQKSAHDWEKIGQEEIQGAFGIVQPTADWLRDSHALESDCVVKVQDGVLGSTVQAGFPVHMSRTKPSVRWGRPSGDPIVNDEIDWLGAEFQYGPAPEKAGDFPLEGIRVLDCASLLAGPTTARILAQYGADVIKIDKSDIATTDGDPLSDDEFAFIGSRTVNPGKRMVFLDLKDSRGQQVLWEILKTTDIVHHNFTPQAASRLGLSLARILSCNPDAIVSTMSLHSHGGHRASYRGHDQIAQCVTGMANRFGGEASPRLSSTFMNDFAAGHLNAFGVILALLHRYRTGETQQVNSSLSRTATLLQVPFMIDYEGQEHKEPSGPEARGWHALDRLYKTRDRWIYFAGGDRVSRSALEKCSLLSGVADIADENLESWLETRFSELPTQEIVDQLVAAGFGAHPHLTLEDMLFDPIIAQREAIAVTENPGLGKTIGIGAPVYPLSSGDRTELLVHRRPGMDTIPVLQEFGFGDRIVELLQDRVIATGEKSVLNAPLTKGFWSKAERISPFGGAEITNELIRKIQDTKPSAAYEHPKEGICLSIKRYKA